MRLNLRALVVVALATLALAVPASAQQIDVIRGQVVGPEGKPLEDAKVTKMVGTRSPFPEAKETTSSSSPRSVTEPGGSK